MFLVLVIFVACIAAFCIRTLIVGKSRIHFADTRHAMREFEKGNIRPPSWSSDKTRTQEFLYVVRKLATHKGVPEDFASKAVLALTNASVALVHYTGTVEAQGASFNSQKVAAADFLYTLWNNASPAERMVLLAAPEQGDYTGDTDKASVRQRSVLDELDDMAVELLSSCADDDRSKKFVDSYYESVDLALKQGNKKTLAIPSWAKREGELKLFLSCVTEKSSRQGVASTYAILMFHNKDTQSMILDCVAQAESQGFDFVKQIGIGVEFIKEAWRSLDDENKNKALNITLDEKALEALSGMN
ncbi:MAG TPA: hypothetical protein VFA99_15385 [Acidobacteriaceae bacterium]|nr:hypothetical protein [Acidobacteriaceae bacterium]